MRVHVLVKTTEPLPCTACFRPTVLVAVCRTARGTRPYFVGMLCPDDLIKHRLLVLREAAELAKKGLAS